MRVNIRRAAAIAAGTVIAAGVATVPATAAGGDTRPPALTVLPHAQFTQGGIIGASDAPTPDQDTFVYGIPMYTTWRGSDASGICGYDVQEDYAG